MRSLLVSVLALGVTLGLWSFVGIKALQEAAAIEEFAADEAYGQPGRATSSLAAEDGDKAENGDAKFVPMMQRQEPRA
jgi:hypothetical protein